MTEAAEWDERYASTDRVWADLLSYRDAVAARHTAASRAPTTPPRFRPGHTAPANRPDRRRFTPWGSRQALDPVLSFRH